ncbi:MAG TPA: hypothetical protein PKL78_02510 [Anaerolineales bacterium]|nr:hypothetical protein [Anaerolineales bacterium]HNN12401.1 hypothetical protein [Anaerolineales bacterium]
MKIIDKSPFQDASGNINIVARLQGTLKYGFNWYPEQEAQKKVIPPLDRSLDKGLVLIRNFQLPYSDIVIPMILIGIGAVYIILVSPVKGHFEAKGVEWNTIVGNGASVPARRNLIDLLTKLTRAFQKYLERQRINIPVPVEAVLILSDPGAQIESLRPVVRVVRSDAIKQFTNEVSQARPVLRTDSILALGDRITTPKSIEEVQNESFSVGEVSRAQGIFNASSHGFNPDELGFEFNEDANAVESGPQQPDPREPNPARPLPMPAAPPRKKNLGLSRTQIILLAGMILVEVCVIVAGAGILFYFNQ